jgi:ribosomal-protein-serine acetyltransferase
MGYWLSKQSQGKGVMTQSCKMLIDFGFSELKLHKIEITHAAENHRSAKVIKNVGFIHEGRIRHYEYINNKWLDNELYGLLASEWHE